MELNIRAFGIAREIIGAAVIKMEVGEHITTADLKAVLEKTYQPLGRLSSFLLAVNDEYAQPEDVISAGDEIAIIPPVSGG